MEMDGVYMVDMMMDWYQNDDTNDGSAGGRTLNISTSTFMETIITITIT
jgi:hypothetical protein